MPTQCVDYKRTSETRRVHNDGAEAGGWFVGGICGVHYSCGVFLGESVVTWVSIVL